MRRRGAGWGGGRGGGAGFGPHGEAEQAWGASWWPSVRDAGLEEPASPGPSPTFPAPQGGVGGLTKPRGLTDGGQGIRTGETQGEILGD